MSKIKTIPIKGVLVEKNTNILINLEVTTRHPAFIITETDIKQ
jgi:hypothetical protein